MSKNPSQTLWFTGLPGSGKTTISKAFSESLRENGKNVCIIDGDELRAGLCQDLGFGKIDRAENMRRAAHIAKILNLNGIYALVAMVSPYAEDRDMAYEIIGKDRCMEVYVSTPLEICEQRDPKGLYARARSGSNTLMTGIQSPYEAPREPSLTIDTSREDLSISIRNLNALLNK
ncbi:adenylyl-sulfate kinase [Comamonas guangdongensis]|uniref:Adenylyl-sulfate kinase n=1 Tax=Comamonas guangdongensis TaxID=510515 RepID=A0ABV3ZZ43_9BURK